MNFRLRSNIGLPFHSKDFWHGLVVDELWQKELKYVDSWLMFNPGDTVVEHLSRDVTRVETTLGVVYVKYIRALTDDALQGRDAFSRAKWYCRPSRALATWRISERLLAEGFACPVPVLAARRRIFLRPFYGHPHDIFIAHEIPWPNLWDEPGMPPEQLALLLAAETARFHNAGFAHGDFILRNLCLNPATRHLIFLDNDRTWHPLPPIRWHYQRRNLDQMAYSLLRRFNTSDVLRAFLNEYHRLTWTLPGEEVAKILRKAEKRLANRQSHG